MIIYWYGCFWIFLLLLYMCFYCHCTLFVLCVFCVFLSTLLLSLPLFTIYYFFTVACPVMLLCTFWSYIDLVSYCLLYISTMIIIIIIIIIRFTIIILCIIIITSIYCHCKFLSYTLISNVIFIILTIVSIGLALLSLISDVDFWKGSVALLARSLNLDLKRLQNTATVFHRSVLFWQVQPRFSPLLCCRHGPLSTCGPDKQMTIAHRNAM